MTFHFMTFAFYDKVFVFGENKRETGLVFRRGSCTSRGSLSRRVPLCNPISSQGMIELTGRLAGIHFVLHFFFSFSPQDRHTSQDKGALDHRGRLVPDRCLPYQHHVTFLS